MDDFIALVAEMRRWQKEYFKTHDRSLVPKCKALEKQVDEAIAELGGIKKPAQATLAWE